LDILPVLMQLAVTPWSVAVVAMGPDFLAVLLITGDL
jgi:hypothetical protein